MEKNNNIGDVYKKAFEDFEVTPSPNTWTKIEKSIVQKPLLQQYKWGLVSLAGIIVLLSAYFLFKPNVAEQPQEIASHSNENQPVEQVHTVAIITDSIGNDEKSEEENLSLTVEQSNIHTQSAKEEKTVVKNTDRKSVV